MPAGGENHRHGVNEAKQDQHHEDKKGQEAKVEGNSDGDNQSRNAGSREGGPPAMVKGSPPGVIQLDGIAIEVYVQRVHGEGIGGSHGTISQRCRKACQRVRGNREQKRSQGNVDVGIGKHFQNPLESNAQIGGFRLDGF